MMIDFELREFGEGTTATCPTCGRRARFRVRNGSIHVIACYAHALEMVEEIIEKIRQARRAS